MKILKNKENLLILVLLLVLVATLTIGKVVADTISASDIPMSSNDTTKLKTKLDVLSNKSRPTTCPSNAICTWKKSWANVNVGDYVQMTPNPKTLDSQDRYLIDTNKTGYSTAEYIYPKELKLWRVIRINSNGTIDLVSAYLSSTTVHFTGTLGYANFIGYLNILAKQYENPLYTVGSRHMGYNGQTEFITNTSVFDGTSTTAPWNSSTTTIENIKPEDEEKGAGDTLYTTDTNLVKIAYGNQGDSSLIAKKCNSSICDNPITPSFYWLATRNYHYNSATSFSFCNRVVFDTGKIVGCNGSIRAYFNESWRNSSGSYSIRPIITLKSDLNVPDAVGSYIDPFVLE